MALAAASCSSKASGTIKLVTGGETDTFTQAPQPTTLRVDSIDSSGNTSNLATAMLPADTVDLGSVDQSAARIIKVSGLDTSGTRVVAGQSIPLLFGWLDGATLPVFVQRTGELARMPSPPPDARPSPVVGVIEGRFVVVTGGTDPTLAPTTMIYDLEYLAPTPGAVTLPRTPKSMAILGLIAWLVDDTGVSQYAFSSSTATSVTLPSGPTFADISGGATITAPDGSQYIVGATRSTGAATSAALAIDSSNNPSWIKLTVPRLGAAAAWVPNLGLVVAGGNSAMPGAEVVPVAAPAGTQVLEAYAPDPSVGSGATALDSTHVLLAGGLLPDGSSAGVRVIDVSCTSQCAPRAWPAPGLPLTSAQAFAVDANSAVVVGSEPPAGASPGLTHIYRVNGPGAPVNPGAVIEVSTKVAHTHAGAIASPIGVSGSVLLFGGAPEIESLAL